MKQTVLYAALAALFAPLAVSAAGPLAGLSKAWTYSHSGGQAPR